MVQRPLSQPGFLMDLLCVCVGVCVCVLGLRGRGEVKGNSYRFSVLRSGRGKRGKGLSPTIKDGAASLSAWGTSTPGGVFTYRFVCAKRSPSSAHFTPDVTEAFVVC